MSAWRHCLLALLLGTAPAGAAPIDGLIEEAERKLQAGDDAGALLVLARAEKEAPGDPRPQYLKGGALAHQGKRAEAIVAFRAALRLNPHLAEVHNELGVALQETGQLDAAIAEFRAATEQKPRLGEAWLNLGRGLRSKGDLAGALKTLQQACLAVPRDLDLLIDLSLAFRDNKRMDEALGTAREAVRVAPGSPEAHLHLGFTLQAAGKLDEAAAEMTAVTKAHRGLATGWWALGVLERERKHHDLALAHLEQASKIKDSPSVDVDIARTWAAKGDLRKAEATLRKAVADHPRSLSARVELVRVLGGLRACPEAQKLVAGLPASHREVIAVQLELVKACPAARK